MNNRRRTSLIAVSLFGLLAVTVAGAARPLRTGTIVVQ